MTRQVRFGLAIVLAFILTISAFIYAGFYNDSPSAPIRRIDARTVTQTATLQSTLADTSNDKSLKAIVSSEGPPQHRIRSLALTKKPKAPTKTPPPKIIHVVQGQCLWTIAQNYKTTVAKLVAENHLKTDVLQIGQVLRIPPESNKSLTAEKPKPIPIATSANQSVVYTVHPGDSLWKISLAYGVTISKLRADNHLSSNALHAGERLIIHAPKARFHLTAASRKLIEQAPAKLLPVYKGAAKKYGIPWTVLAAIHKEETDFCIKNAPVSSAGAIGPMQFMPETFRIYGVAAPGHKYPNINNVKDAIYSAAHMLAVKGFKRDPYHAIYDYNQSTRYVHDILRMSAV